MAEKDKENQQSGRPISRREFAISSIGILGAYSLAEAAAMPPLSAEAQAMKLEKTDDIQDLMVARHILDEDLKRVIDHAERTGEKLYQPDSKRFLAKLRVKEAYFYVEYEPAEDAYRIHAAYTHRFLLGEDI
jgi:hypothetical protein